LIVLLTHSDTVVWFARAAASIRLMSWGLNLIGTIRPFASPFGSFGRPIFALICFAMFPELLNDCCLYGSLGRNNGRDVQDGYVALGTRRIVRLVNPSIDPIGLWTPLEAEDLDNTIPDRFPLK
jgi:hypothetical protein